MKRVIKITEFLQKTFTVEADNEDEALDIVNIEYLDKGNIVLMADDYAGNEVEDVTDDYSSESIDLLPSIDRLVTDWRNNNA